MLSERRSLLHARSHQARIPADEKAEHEEKNVAAKIGIIDVGGGLRDVFPPAYWITALMKTFVSMSE